MSATEPVSATETVRAWRAGAWRLRGDAALFERARAALEADARAAEKRRGPRELGGLRAFHKASPLALRPALRHATRAALGLADVPRLQEHANLEWLRARGLAAVRPLLAGALRVRGLPRWQFLVTELEDAPTLAEVLADAHDPRRAPALDALARDVARMHALGFVHRDLFPRNLLVRGRGADARCAFLDAWRGAPGRGRRPPEHDLGCLMLDGATLLTIAEQARFLRAYRSARAAAGHGVGAGWAGWANWANWERRVERARARVLARESRRRDVAPEWHFPP